MLRLTTMEARAQGPSFEEIVRTLRAPLRRYLRRLAGDDSVADDLLQETLLRIARGLAAFDGRSSVKTWAFSIATRVAADHFRAPAQRLRIAELEEAGEVADEGRAALERIVIDEMNACVRRVIDGLPADYRAALVLHDLEGLGAEEVARVCGCTLATAKIRIHRARARLRQALRGECDFYRDGENVLRCERKRP